MATTKNSKARPAATPAFFSPLEVAQIMGVTSRTVWNMIQDKRLDGIRFGRSWRIPRKAVEPFINAAAATTDAQS